MGVASTVAADVGNTGHLPRTSSQSGGDKTHNR